MIEIPKAIELLRSFTNHPARALWWAAGFGSLLTLWTIHVVADEAGWGAALSRLCSGDGLSSGILNTSAVFALWAAMSLAMMLPSAAPMISAYLDIAHAARQKGTTVAAAAHLVGGYAMIWLLFAAAATAMQSAVAFTPGWALANKQLAAILLLTAGLYQFAPLKHACLSKCRSPMFYFLSRWSDRAGEVFRMGVEQGLLCLACCWALMLLMFAAGAMNVAWMAGLTVLIVLEKSLPDPRPIVYGAGAGLAGAGVFALLGS